MMDPRRLDTMGVIAAGILNRGVPDTDVPDDREEFDGSGDSWEYVGDDAVVEALDRGDLVRASNYYGIPYVWKAADGVYRGQLLQYRALTEDHTWDNAQDAAEWFGETYYATDG